MLLSVVYFVAAQADLDVTPTLAQRLIEGWTGRSISNRTLIRAFGVEGRTAGAKSLDFEKLEELIEAYGPNVRKALLKDKGRIRFSKDAAWLTVQATGLSKMRSHG